MIYTYLSNQNILSLSHRLILNKSTRWIDLFNITPQEEMLVEKFLGIDIPTKEETEQIETSYRLYTTYNAIYMTALLMPHNPEACLTNHSITFILYNDILITVRYTKINAINTIASKINDHTISYTHGYEIMIEILSNIIEPLADFFENIKRETNITSGSLFLEANDKTILNYQNIIKQIGRHGNLISKSKESIMSITRVMHYLLQSCHFANDSPKMVLQTLISDIKSISDYAASLSAEVAFLLDATLGMIEIDQNKMMRVFSVLAVIFMPPTLIASIYGMNFVFMPETAYYLGYPITLLLMIVSAWIPYKIFKIKKWL
ncbi:MAG: CorA family divalent cation transporter [Rickettsiaceae bacterium]